MTRKYQHFVKRKFIPKQEAILVHLGAFTSFDTILKILYDVEGLSSTEISYFFEHYCDIPYSRQKLSKRIRQLGLLRDYSTAYRARHAPIKRSLADIYESIRFGGKGDSSNYRKNKKDSPDPISSKNEN